MTDTDSPNSDEVHDLFYTAACSFSPNQSHLLQWLKNRTAIRPIVDALTTNLLRVWSLSVLPQGVMHTAVVHNLLLCEATMEVVGRPFLEEGDTREMLNQIEAKFIYLDAPQRPPRVGINETMNHLIHYHKKKLIPTLRPGFLALLGAQVIQTLTAFETLAQDLWIAAVNERPKTLGSKQALTAKWPPSITKFQMYDFNLKRRMGSLIADNIHWDSFREMRDAYKLAFDDDSITNVFSDPRLNVVNETRNVLVHNAGKADKKLKAAVKGTSYFPNLVCEEEVPLDGKQVCGLTEAVIDCCQTLIRGVDSWLDQNPD